MMKSRWEIGINPISWFNDDMTELGGETSLETALRDGSAIGYDGFELGNKFPKDAHALKELLATYRLRCVSGWYSSELLHGTVREEIARCSAHMHKLQYNGCRVVVYGEVAGSIQGDMSAALCRRPRLTRSEQWRDYGRKLNEFGAHIKNHHGLTLAYHHHMGAVVQAPEDVDRLMENTAAEKVSLLFDSGHAAFGGAEDVVALLTRHIARVAHVHCKDVRSAVMQRALNGQWSFMHSVLAGVFTVPGDGAVDFAAILRVLQKNDYRGWLVVEAEQDPAVAPSEFYARKGYDHLRQLMERL